MGTGPLETAEPGTLEHRVLSPSDAEADHRRAGIEFRHLRYFAVVAEERHFGRAAARLFITQPGLSQAIARLERELEVQLFTRTRSNVELTNAGTELLDHARGLLAGLDDAVTQVRVAGRGKAGLVRVGVALLAEPVVAPALKAFQEHHEAIVVDRSAMVSERLLAHLAEGRLHAAVIHQVPALTTETVAREPLQRGRLAIVASPASKLAHQEAVTLSELSDQTFLVNPAHSPQPPTKASSSCAASTAGSTLPSWNPPPPQRLHSTPTGAPSRTAPPSRSWLKPPPAR